MEFHLMANNLYLGICDDEEPENKKTVAARSLQCYAIINLNLSDSCRDVLRRLKTRDPKACWEALALEYEQINLTSTMMLLDGLLDFQCTTCVLDYISTFNLYLSKLQSMDIVFNEALHVALLLRGLPPQYEIFCSTVRHREKMPSLDQLFFMLKLEEKTIPRKGTNSCMAFKLSKKATCDVKGCGKVGHTRDQCWILHPEQAPVCTTCGKSGHFARFCTNATNLTEELQEADTAWLAGNVAGPPISL
jgi:hypothetical protein